MGLLRRKTSSRRNQVRKNIAAERFSRLSQSVDIDLFLSIVLLCVFIALCTFVLSFDLDRWKNFRQTASIAVMVVLISAAGALYIHHFQKRIIKNRVRELALVSLFILLLSATKYGVLLTGHTVWAVGTAVIAAIILTIAYSQRFAIGMSIFYSVLACFAAGPTADFNLFLIMAAGVITCCFSLKEIRTRMKLIEVSTLAAVMVFATAMALELLGQPQLLLRETIYSAALKAGVALAVGLLIQSLLPLIEKVFRIATSMTLLDYTDANQPLLKRLAMEAPGTFSHSLLIGSVAEAAAEAIGRNGLLCRVGAYYHDIGKINKPDYFVENEIGSVSRHAELSPAMSQLVIVGHVKDGMEMAREYALPAVLRQFIETHHGTTLVEYFYSEAKKKYEEEQAATSPSAKKAVRSSPAPSESEFRYPGPKPRTKEAAIVMLADTIEGAVRSLGADAAPAKIEAVVHNMAMKRLQDGQFDECDLSLRELSQIETSISKTLAAHYHGRIAYPHPPDMPDDAERQKVTASEQANPQRRKPEPENDDAYESS